MKTHPALNERFLLMRKWIITFFGAGLSPVAPGTVGSVLASVGLLIMFPLVGASFAAWQIALLVGLVLSSMGMIALGPWAVGYFGRKDPQACVLDEVAGICLTNLLLPMLVGWREAVVIGIALLAFRLFDVTKPPPARQLEALPLGWGILFDDLAAAVYANLLCQIVVRLALQHGMI